MKFSIYWLISENYQKTYVGFSENFEDRILQHKAGRVRSTKGFGKFHCHVLEKVDTLEAATKREKYWKSSAGRKKLKVLYQKLESAALSSNG